MFTRNYDHRNSVIPVLPINFLILKFLSRFFPLCVGREYNTNRNSVTVVSTSPPYCTGQSIKYSMEYGSSS